MINLIPSVAKRRVVTEYWMRVGSLWIGMMSILCIIFIILLIPVWVLIYSQINLNLAAASTASSEVERYETSAASLITASQRARLLISTNENKSFSDVINLISDLEITGVEVNSYELTRTITSNQTSLNSIQISGRAATRQDLAMFRERLLSNESIATVVLPISNLARDRDILFSITLTLNPE